jgi:protein-disulfide isomerase
MGDSGTSRRTQLIVLGVFAALILVAAIVISQSGSDSDSGGADSGDAAEIEANLEGIPQDGVLLGDASAAEKVVEFVDLQCPFCAEFSTGALPDVIDQHVRGGEIAYELRVISFLGEDSGKAAQMAAAATLQNRLFEFAETFYLNQGEENSGYVTEDFLTRIAEDTPGLDAEEALSAQDSPEAQAIVDENEAEAQRLGVGSTPTFFLLAGGQPTELPLTDLTAEAFGTALDSARSGG